MIDEAIRSLGSCVDLSAQQMESVMEEIMTGAVATREIVAFLKVLSVKGETVEEVSSAVEVMRRHALHITSRHAVVLDTCGTGGDGKNTFDISTAAAFVVSGAGIPVAKHGNRSVSSRSGSADVLEALGIDIGMSPQHALRCLDEIGLAFLFAQTFHPAMKYVMPARKEIGARTIFNVLGPLSNPAGASHQIVGVFNRHWAQVIAGALTRLGTQHALVVHGTDGLDEISTAAPTIVFEAAGRAVSQYTISPSDFGIPQSEAGQFAGGSAQDNALILTELLNGKRGPVRDIVVLNAAAAICAAGEAGSGVHDLISGIRAGVDRANESLDSGKALRQLKLLQEYSRKAA